MSDCLTDCRVDRKVEYRRRILPLTSQLVANLLVGISQLPPETDSELLKLFYAPPFDGLIGKNKGRVLDFVSSRHTKPHLTDKTNALRKCLERSAFVLQHLREPFTLTQLRFSTARLQLQSVFH